MIPRSPSCPLASAFIRKTRKPTLTTSRYTHHTLRCNGPFSSEISSQLPVNKARAEKIPLEFPGLLFRFYPFTKRQKTNATKWAFVGFIDIANFPIKRFAPNQMIFNSRTKLYMKPIRYKCTMSIKSWGRSSWLVLLLVLGMTHLFRQLNYRRFCCVVHHISESMRKRTNKSIGKTTTYFLECHHRPCQGASARSQILVYWRPVLLLFAAIDCRSRRNQQWSSWNQQRWSAKNLQQWTNHKHFTI